MKNKNIYNPDKISPPGDTLFDIIEERGISQSKLADLMCLPSKTINEIVNGKAEITYEIAIKLEKILCIPSEFWLKRESNYRLFHVKHLGIPPNLPCK